MLALWIHIPAGVIGLLSGAAAFYFKKGSSRHNFAGRVFVWSMLGMSVTGAYLGYYANELDSLLVGVLTFYLVATSWITSIRKAGERGILEYAALLYVLAFGAIAFGIGLKAENVAPQGFYMMAVLALLLSAGDLHTIFGRYKKGAQRIARHLWRMGFAYFIAVLSFFIGQPQLFPESIRNTYILAAPVIIVAIVVFYWLYRVLFAKGYNKVIQLTQSYKLNRK